MILHIFKKDCRLLWHWILAVAVLNLSGAVLWALTGSFEFKGSGTENPYVLTANIESLVLWGATFLLIAMAVQQDSLATPAPDCWTRPIRRRDLVLAKVCFALVAVQGPIFLGDLAQALVFGFPSEAAVLAAAIRWLTWCGLSLSVIALASVTRKLTTMIFVGLLWIGGSLLLGNWIAGLLSTSRQPLPTYWIDAAFSAAASLIGATVVLLLVYGGRRLVAGRLALAATGTLLCLLPLLLDDIRGNIQAWLGTSPSAAIRVRAALDTPLLATSNTYEHAIYQGRVHVGLPLEISGLPDDAVLLINDAHVQVRNASGSKLYARRMGRTTNLRAQAGVVKTIYPITLPEKVHLDLLNQPLRIELAYSFTLAKLRASQKIDAEPRAQHLEGIGWCKTRIVQYDPAPSAARVNLYCLNSSRPPACEITRSVVPGTRHETFRCEPDYAPVPLLLSRTVLRGAFPFNYGARPSQAPPGTSVLLETYVPTSHFVKELVVEVEGIAPASPVRTSGISRP